MVVARIKGHDKKCEMALCSFFITTSAVLLSRKQLCTDLYHKIMGSFSLLHTKRFEKLRQVWCAKARHSVPSLCSRKAARVATIRATIRDICEQNVAVLIQPWVDKTHRRLSCCDQCIIEQSENSGSDRRGTRCAHQVQRAAIPDDREDLSDCTNIRVCTT